jgi:hypothetical protein
MPHPEEEAEKQEGHDVQGGSGHCARAKVVISGRIMQRFDPTQFPYARAPHATAAVRGRSAVHVKKTRQIKNRARFRFYQNGKDFRDTGAAREDDE